MSTKALNIYIVALFSIVLVAPTYFSFFECPWCPDINENRSLATFPKFPKSLHETGNFLAQFDTYFNDNFGLRNCYIYLYAFFTQRLLNTSPNKSVAIGQDGWLFYDNYKQLERNAGLYPPFMGEPELWIKLYKLKKDWLESRGIKYYIVIAPDKSTIYPEYLPKYQGNRKTSVVDTIIKLGVKENLNFIDLRNTLLNAKSKSLLYCLTDTHWNPIGSLVTSQYLYSKFKINFPELGNFKDISAYSIVPDPFYWRGDLSYMVGLGDFFNEKFVTLKANYKISQKLENDYYESVIGNIPIKKITTERTAKVNLLFFHDSFGEKMVPFISPEFYKSTFVATYPSFGMLKDLAQQLAPNLVVEEILERELINTYRYCFTDDK